MPSSPKQDLRQLLDHIATTLPTERPTWPGGYPDQVELALIDAVLSIRTRHGRAGNGVRKRVQDYAKTRPSAIADDLGWLSQVEADDLVRVLNTTQVTAGTPKPVAIVQGATNLVDVGVRRSSDLDPTSRRQQRAYCAVHGLGNVTWEYFLMLSHHPGVKADTWIIRFVQDALGRRADSRVAGALVKEAATGLSLSPTELDYAIWHHMSGNRGDNGGNRAGLLR